MTSSNFATQTTFDDIVFEGRNREYGAYLLRKLYTRNLYRGVFTAIALFMLFLSLPLILNKLFPKEFVPPKPIQIEPVTTIIEVELPELPKEAVQPATPAETTPAAATPTTAPPTRIVKPPVISATGTQTMDPVDLPPGVQPGTTNSEGTGGTSILPNAGTGTGSGTGDSEVAIPEKIFDFVEVNPEFPGGEAAMMKYLSQNIRYPSVAARNKLEGLVVVQFVVNEEGHITGLTILKNLGGGTDEEAMRVIKNMPPWKPGMQNGRTVKVRYRLPIKFTLQR